MDIFLEYDQLIKHNPEVNYIKDQKITANEQSRERTTGNGKKFKKLLKKQKQDHKIDLIENMPKKLNTKTYTMMIKKDKVLNQQLDEQLKTELIIESSSRYMTLCFYIPKKKKLLQLVQDYRKLNQYTIKNKMPLFLIRKVIDKLKDIKYFNKLDLTQDYNNV